MLLLLPLMLVIVRLRNRSKVIVAGDEGIEVPHRLTRGIDRLPWPAIARVEDRGITRNGVKVGRALWLHHAGGSAQILESDLGAETFARLAALVRERAAR